MAELREARRVAVARDPGSRRCRRAGTARASSRKSTGPPAVVGLERAKASRAACASPPWRRITSVELHAAAVVAVGRRACRRPRAARSGTRVCIVPSKLRSWNAGPEVVALEVGEDVAARGTAAELRALERRDSRCRRRPTSKQRRRGREQAVEDARAAGSYTVSTSATRRSRSIVQVCDVAAGAADLRRRALRPRARRSPSACRVAGLK